MKRRCTSSSHQQFSAFSGRSFWGGWLQAILFADCLGGVSLATGRRGYSPRQINITGFVLFSVSSSKIIVHNLERFLKSYSYSRSKLGGTRFWQESLYILPKSGTPPPIKKFQNTQNVLSRKVYLTPVLEVHFFSILVIFLVNLPPKNHIKRTSAITCVLLDKKSI